MSKKNVYIHILQVIAYKFKIHENEETFHNHKQHTERIDPANEELVFRANEQEDLDLSIKN